MFEKSLYDLIRGMRNHKGREREYMQASIRECRNEIKGQDMDLKATAVLKLTYMEMFGHDISWASFNILEVMSSPKFLQKRAGYLGAMQSFRPDTEVLMLAENLLKKDLASTQLITISLPLIAIPHVISPSMANSLLSDLLTRLTHSSPGIRKKTIVTLYRLALVYPETLRPAWPKIKERLLDENEDSSVTSAVVNVVCELGWRRPHDFLPLAPRLFDLLVSGGNNWMAIKIIKLFATLTPLEPRLINKLLPPLTSIIQTTPAMSLLYECINGIIQGGVLENAQGTTKGDEIARLCVSKLRGMLLVEGDPNLKYVALLAFNRIVEMHPYLVTSHEDVVMECIDDIDISIRLRALDLVAGMVNAQNLVPIVDRLMAQLENSPIASSADDPVNDRGSTSGVVPMADSDESDAEQTIRPIQKPGNKTPALPDEYRNSVINKILEICARDTYANINDFEWYIDVLVKLVRCLPGISEAEQRGTIENTHGGSSHEHSVAYQIGSELRNVAIRVKSSRGEATRAAELLTAVDQRARLFPLSGGGGQGVLEPVIFIVGEFAHFLSNPHGTIDSMLHGSTLQLPGSTLSAYLQALLKVFSRLTGDERQNWTHERKTITSLLAAKVSTFLESLTTHPNLEVQERAVEYLELSRLASEAINAHSPAGDGEFAHPPLLLTQAIPALFSGMELNPVAKNAQKKVPIPDALDLDKPINENLQSLLDVAAFDVSEEADDDFYQFYHERPQPVSVAPEPAAKRLDASEMEFSYQQSNGDYLEPEVIARRKADRRERNKDDPFYIPSTDTSGRATPIHNILKASNGEDLDVDSIPIMELDLEDHEATSQPILGARPSTSTRHRPRRNFEILGDETVGDAEVSSADAGPEARRLLASRATKSLLQVDSSGLGSLSLNESNSRSNQLDYERRQAEEAEMAQAMEEVERLRLAMQREAEKIQIINGPPEGTVVKRKKKKKKVMATAVGEAANAPPGEGELEQQSEGEQAIQKKKKSRSSPSQAPEVDVEELAASKPKKKKKRRQITFDEDDSLAVVGSSKS